MIVEKGGASMFTRSHARAIRAGIAIAIGVASVAIVIGCSTVQPVPTVVAASAKPPPPLKLCTEADGTPAAIASKPGFIQFSVSVTDKDGAPAANLRKADFAASVGPQSLPIAHFRSASKPRPVSIVMLIDISGSMQPKLPTVRRALDDFMAKLNPCDEVAVYVFGSTAPGGPADVTLIQDFTTDYQLAADQLASVKPWGPTPLYDAVDDGLRILNRSHYPNRVVVLITDGMDNASTLSKAQVIGEARTDGVPIYAIGIGDPNARRGRSYTIGSFIIGTDDINSVDGSTLKALAEESHGRAFIVPEMKNDNGKAFKAAVAEIGGLISDRYTIGVIVPPPATTPTVTVANYPDAQVHVLPEDRKKTVTIPLPSVDLLRPNPAHR
jgi:VWFA-related protein